MRLTLALFLSAALGLAGCSSVKDTVTPDKPAAAPVQLTTNIADKAADVKVDTVVTADASQGEVTGASLYFGDDPTKNVVKGMITSGRWVATELLEPSQTYHLEVKGQNADGKPATESRTFSTQVLSVKNQLTYPSIAPLAGETVGVGMPVIVKFDLPVHNRAVFERKMRVESTPAVTGSWSWISDYEVHYRPQKYWPAGTKVRVILNVNSLAAGDGVYGQKNQDVSFTIGRSVVSTVNIKTHKLTVDIDGKVAKVIPVTTGDASHQTREGTKVIMEKFNKVDMDAASTGIKPSDPGYYNIKDVKWAMRLTNSGEFLHAAPWSIGSQGYANVSHGCTGMTTANAAWLYSQSKRGDIVKFTGSTRSMEPGNGYTDWNMSWADWLKRSAVQG